MKKKVLLLEGIHKEAEIFFKEKGYAVELLPGALSKEELIKKLPGVSVLGIRSKTEIDKDIVVAGKDLEVIGCYIIGINKVDLHACSLAGISVFNAPFSSSRSVVELAVGYMVALVRKLMDKNVKMHQGVWEKSAEGCYELRGKTLGIVGYGNIGSQLAVVAEGLGMKIMYVDVSDRPAIGNAQKVGSLEELLQNSDIVTLHVDGNDSTKNLISAPRLALMKKGSYLLNLSRGFVVDVEALAEHLKSGHLAGAALDVFPEEPATNGEGFKSVMQNVPNALLTPHIGASTQEAQKDIALTTSEKALNYLEQGTTVGSVNVPEVCLSELQPGVSRLISIHKNVPGVLSKINGIVAEANLNVSAQDLRTAKEVGYAVVEVEGEIDPKILQAVEEMKETIKNRLITVKD